MIKDCIANLHEIEELLSSLTDEQYAHPSILMSGASIGQHIRHILEFYKALLYTDIPMEVNYDNRGRNLRMEKHSSVALQTIDELTAMMKEIVIDQPVYLVANYHSDGSETVRMNSYLFRELAYCLEHSIHHQALIKIGLVEQNLEDLIDVDFGVAPATIRFRNDTHVEA